MITCVRPDDGRLTLVSVGLLLLVGVSLAQAQIVLDGSFGTSGALEGTDVSIPHTDGSVVGRNLFHSFSEFNIRSGERATFTYSGSGPIDNVLSRVSGGSASTIDGTLRSTIPAADLFLINPAGVVFGPGAALDISGAFHVSSADYVRLDDGTRFNALPSTADVQLSTAPPAAFGFLHTQPGAIRFSGSQLSVASGQSISVVGGEIDIAANAQLFGFAVGSSLQAPQGRITVVSSTSPDEVALGLGGSDIGSAPATGEVRVSGGSAIGVAGNSGGDIYIRAGKLTLAGTLVDASGFVGPAGTVYLDAGTGGEIEVTAGGGVFALGPSGGDIALHGKSIAVKGASVAAQAFSEDIGGTLTFDADAIRISGGSQLSTSGLGTGGGQSFQGDSISFDDSRVDALVFGTAPGGEVRLSGREVSLDHGTQINVGTVGPGSAGRVSIDATETLSVAGENAAELRSGIFADAVPGFGASGDAGTLSVNAGELRLQGGTSVSANSFGSGKAGRLDIAVSGPIELSGRNSAGNGSSIAAESKSVGADGGAAGVIVIAADEVRMSDGAQIDASTAGGGRGGEVRLDIADNLVLSGRGTALVNLSRAATAEAGDAGSVDVVAGQLNIADGASIAAGTGGPGSGGRVRVVVEGEVALRGSGLGGETPSRIVLDSGTASLNPAGASAALGNAGHLELAAGALRLEDGAVISADAYGAGRGGDLTFRVAGAVDLSGETALGRGALIQSTTRSESSDAGDGGSIDLKAQRLGLANGAQISTFTLGPGNAGSVAVQVDNAVVLSGTTLSPVAGERQAFISSIFSLSDSRLASAGDAGAISIDAGSLSINDGAYISTEVAGGAQAGAVVLNVAGSLQLSGQSRFGRGSRINTSTRAQGVSQTRSGNIDIKAGALRLSDGAQLSATTFGPGKAGDVLVQVADGIHISGKDARGFNSGIFSASLNDASGDSGDIDLRSRDLTVVDSGAIAVSSEHSGDAGDVLIQAGDALVIKRAAIQTTANVANGGNVEVVVGRLVHLVDGAITTEAFAGEGRGGNISIDPEFVILDGGRIIANAFAGPGGNILIVADQFIASPDSAVTASSALNLDGTVVIDSPAEDISAELSSLPAGFLRTAALSLTPCAERSGADVIRLVRKRYDVLPDSPYALRSHFPDVSMSTDRSARTAPNIDKHDTTVTWSAVTSEPGCEGRGPIPD